MASPGVNEADDEAMWFVSIKGRPEGPYTSSVLLAKVRSGEVPADALVSSGTQAISALQFMAQRTSVRTKPREVAGPIPLEEVVDSAETADAGETKFDLDAIPAEAPAQDLPAQQAETELEVISESPVAKAPSLAGLSEPASAAPAWQAPPERDRIVVLGRRQAGKTIFLASVYDKLWRSLDGLTAKAISGEAHQHLMGVTRLIKEGQWPPSTLGSTQIELELQHNGRNRLMVALDFAGELFGKAFLDDQSDWPGVRELVHHIDRAAAVLLLIDPEVVAGMDHRAATEDDFGIVQAVHRIRNWPGGDGVPIVLVLTKSDQRQQLLDRYGGAKGFVRHFFPALVRTLKQMAIFQVSAVQVETRDEKAVPSRDSVPINVDNPLRYCLREIEKSEQKVETARQRQEQEQAQKYLEHLEQREEKRRGWMIAGIVVGTLILGIVVIVLILVYKV